MRIKVGARASPLSKVQCEEVLSELRRFRPDISFDPLYRLSTGDKDKATSLRTLDKTDFFTKEIDALLLSGAVRLGIHSAKDLPDPIPSGLSVVALTKGVDPSDSLVMADGQTLASLPQGALIATSSVRREEQVRALRPDLTFCDIRGTIGERIAQLSKGQVAAVVVAEAALIRLGLTHLNRVTIPGATAPYQGQLAVLARKDDDAMVELFAPLDTRRRVFHTGLTPPPESLQARTFHLPLIAIREFLPEEPAIRDAFAKIETYTHLLFTSKTAATLFSLYLHFYNKSSADLKGKVVIAVGRATARHLESLGISTDYVAEQEHSEGVAALLETLDLEGAKFLWPHSLNSRSVIPDYFARKGIALDAVVFYEPVPNRPAKLPDLQHFDEIHFTSPSTIDAFLSFYGGFPQNIKLTGIGPVTEQALGALRA